MSPAQAKQVFIRRAAKELDWTEQQVVEALKAKFGTFNIANTAKYMTYLKKVVWEQDEQDLLKEKHPETEAMPCPFHPNVKTFGTHKRGKYSHVHEWGCPVGGKICFNRWKAEQAVGKPLNWSILDNYDSLVRERMQPVTIEELRAQ